MPTFPVKSAILSLKCSEGGRGEGGRGGGRGGMQGFRTYSERIGFLTPSFYQNAGTLLRKGRLAILAAFCFFYLFNESLPKSVFKMKLCIYFDISFVFEQISIYVNFD